VDVGLNFGDVVVEVGFVIVVHVICAVTLEAFYLLIAYCQVKLLVAFADLATNVRICPTHLAIYFFAHVLALRKIADPLRFVFT
jgi:hypothetical protein